MKKFLLTTILASATIVSAHATPVSGPYISLGGGYDLTQTQHATFSPGSNVDGLGTNNSGSAQFRHHNGADGFGSIGYGFGNGLRTEVEGIYYYSDINHLNKTTAPGVTSGSDRNYGVLANAIYDVDLNQFGINSPVTPYVGVGAGYIWSSLHNLNTTYADGQSVHWGGTNGSFAYQGIVGASYDVKAVPGLAVTADYRLLGEAFGSAYHSSTPAGGGNVNFDNRFNHQFNLGLRYAFDSAPPPPTRQVVDVLPPVPDSAPARTYLVFFDWDSANLSARALDIVDHAASASSHVTRIEVNGYADTSALHPGARGEAYNQKLSLRRADAVKARLIHDGVSSASIDVIGHGEKDLLVKTGPNTREPQNRRVEIVLK